MSHFKSMQVYPFYNRDGSRWVIGHTPNGGMRVAGRLMPEAAPMHPKQAAIESKRRQLFDRS